MNIVINCPLKVIRFLLPRCVLVNCDALNGLTMFSQSKYMLLLLIASCHSFSLHAIENILEK